MNSYFASLAPLGVWKLLMRYAVAVPLGYVNLYLKIIICFKKKRILMNYINMTWWYMKIIRTKKNLPHDHGFDIIKWVHWCKHFLAFFLIIYLSERHNGEQANKAHSKEKSNHPTNGEFLHIKWGVPCICLWSHKWTHSKQITCSTTCKFPL